MGDSMPQRTMNEPDWLDVRNLVDSIGEEFKVVVRFSFYYERDMMTFVARGYALKDMPDGAVLVQALSRRQLTDRRATSTTCHTLAFDLWCQLDGGGATAADRGMPRDWDGRPARLRRRSGS